MLCFVDVMFRNCHASLLSYRCEIVYRIDAQELVQKFDGLANINAYVCRPVYNPIKGCAPKALRIAVIIVVCACPVVVVAVVCAHRHAHVPGGPLVPTSNAAPRFLFSRSRDGHMGRLNCSD